MFAPLAPYGFSYTHLPLHLQLLSQGIAGVPTPQEVVRLREGVVATKAAHAMVVRVVGAFAQEAMAVRESAATLVRDAEDWATLAEKGARERLVSMEAECATVLASAREETEGFTRRIGLLKGKLADARQAQDVVEENSQGLSDAAADGRSLRESARNRLRSSPFCKSGAPSYA
jgi:hypothetical protein